MYGKVADLNHLFPDLSFRAGVIIRVSNFFFFPGSKHRDCFRKPAAAAAAAKSRQSCPTLCDPRDGSPLGSPVQGILQARTLEWVAISFSNA